MPNRGTQDLSLQGLVFLVIRAPAALKGLIEFRLTPASPCNRIGNSVAVHDRGLKRNEAICVSGHSRDATAIHGRRTKVSRALYALETNLCLQIDVAL
jgi:hypothetical protein